MHAPLRYAMVGGGRDSFIGAVHRRAMALDGQWQLVAGALSADAEKARDSGRALGLAESRNHGRWQDLLDDELRRPAQERIDAVCIVTPNHLHHPVARAFADAGIAVVCDKPLVHTSAQADELVRIVERRQLVFAVTYNYTGYPMVRQAREMVRAGELGAIRKVVVEYSQGWLAQAVEASGNKQARWRLDPARAGLAGALGDIGSHAENLMASVTGLVPEAVCADLTSFGAGRQLDDDASVLLRFEGGARGVLLASQIEAGSENALGLRVHGEHGSLHWRQERPELLVHAPLEGPRRLLTRGSPGLAPAALRANRLPAGHPEGFIEAFANLYLGVAEHLRAGAEGRAPAPGEADHPTVHDGARGVRFIERVVASSRSSEKWLAWNAETV